MANTSTLKQLVTDFSDTSDVLVVVHGRHLETKKWEELVWGKEGVMGTVPLGLYLALKKGAKHLVLGTGASEKDGVKECEYTLSFLRSHLKELGSFPLFAGIDEADVSKLAELLSHNRDWVVLDKEAQNTVDEIKNSLALCARVGAVELIHVTSPAHVARCSNLIGQLTESGSAPLGVTPLLVSAHSSTDKYCAANTVVFEHPHRGDDHAPYMGDALKKIFGIQVQKKYDFKRDLDTLIDQYNA